jgi:transcriptional regulator with XRE-family HTH domain
MSTPVKQRPTLATIQAVSGYTLQYVADQLNVSQPRVTQIMEGGTIKVDTLRKLAEVYEKPLPEILAANDETRRLNKDISISKAIAENA